MFQICGPYLQSIRRFLSLPCQSSFQRDYIIFIPTGEGECIHVFSASQPSALNADLLAAPGQCLQEYFLLSSQHKMEIAEVQELGKTVLSHVAGRTV